MRSRYTAREQRLATALHVLIHACVEHDNGYLRCRFCRQQRHARDWELDDHDDDCLVLKSWRTLKANESGTDPT